MRELTLIDGTKVSSDAQAGAFERDERNTLLVPLLNAPALATS